MFYEAELRLLRETFQRCRVQTNLLDPNKPIDREADLGLRALLTDEPDSKKNFYECMPGMMPKTIYRMTDPFRCSYLYLLLPDMPQDTVLLIGPFIAKEMTRELLLEICEKHGIATGHIRELEEYYSNVPPLDDQSHLFMLLDVFAERIWGRNGSFSFVDLNREPQRELSPIANKKEPGDPAETLIHMELMEKRYAYENEMIQAVSKGQDYKAEMLLSVFSGMAFEKRLSDPVRNMKNYCIIMNTLLRKAAEQGGVHPVYLDSVSSDFARKIEAVPSVTAVQQLMLEMFRTYCRLVKKHSMRRYSPPVQKAITVIDTDLAANLSLNALATLQNVSPSYLSALFKRETGQTLTDHVNRKRINLAMQLLANTTLQVQTVAQHCGIFDVHYFSKVFRKYTGMTPKEYRESTAH